MLPALDPLLKLSLRNGKITMAQSGKRAARLAEVKQSVRLTPNMLRVTFSGEALTGFPTDAASANIKLLLPHENQTEAAYHASLQGEGIKPIKRTYTVVEYRESSNELDIDFALHEHSKRDPSCLQGIFRFWLAAVAPAAKRYPEKPKRSSSHTCLPKPQPF